MPKSAANTFFQRLTRALVSPNRVLGALSARLRRAPFRIGLARPWPGIYLSYTPDRYSENSSLYVGGGGSLDPEELKAFLRRNTENNSGDLSRFFFFKLVCDQIVKEKLRGDIAELGVYKGNTAILMARLARRIGCTAYLLDTYEGFSRDDLHGMDAGKPVSFMDTSLAAVQSLVGYENVRFIRGRFPGSAEQMPNDLSFCLVHLDCDLYEPFRAALNYFYPRLVPGGFLVMHDYSSLSWNGPEKAADEFFADKPEKLVLIPDKSGTAVARKV